MGPLYHTLWNIGRRAPTPETSRPSPLADWHFGPVPLPGCQLHHAGRPHSLTSRRPRFKNAGSAADARGVDPLSAPKSPAPIVTGASPVQEQRTLSEAVIKLIESCAAAGQDVLPPDATFHTYA